MSYPYQKYTHDDSHVPRRNTFQSSGFPAAEHQAHGRPASMISPSEGYPSLYQLQPGQSPFSNLPPRLTHQSASISFPSPSPYLASHSSSASLMLPQAPQQHQTGRFDTGTLTPQPNFPHYESRAVSPLSAGSDARSYGNSSAGSRGAQKRRKPRQHHDPNDPHTGIYKPRIGGPPQAKLGGPGGQTYDEMVSSKAAKAQAATSSTADDEKRKHTEQGRKGASKWRGKPVVFRPPPATAPIEQATAAKDRADVEVPLEEVDPAKIVLPASDDEGEEIQSPLSTTSNTEKRGSVDLLRSGAIRKPLPRTAKHGDAASAGAEFSEMPTAEIQGAPLRRSVALIEHAAFVRKQLGGVLRPDRIGTASHERKFSSDEARNVPDEDDLRRPPVPEQPGEGVSENTPLQHISMSRDDVSAGDEGAMVTERKSPTPEESPVSKAMRLVQTALTSAKPTIVHVGKRKKVDVEEDSTRSSNNVNTVPRVGHGPQLTMKVEEEDRSIAPLVSRMERASVGPKMGRYLQGQLSGFLKPKGPRSSRSDSPGTVLHGLDSFSLIDNEPEATARDSKKHDAALANGELLGGNELSPSKSSDQSESKLLPALGGSALGLFTFTSQLRPTAGSFHPRTHPIEPTQTTSSHHIASRQSYGAAKKPKLRPLAPVFAPSGPQSAGPPSSIEAVDLSHNRLRGNAPTFQPSSINPTSPRSFPSPLQPHVSPLEPSPSGSFEWDSSLRLRPSAIAFIPSDTLAVTTIPSANVEPVSQPMYDGSDILNDESVTRRDSNQEPGDIFIAAKALRAEATAFVPSDLPRSHNGSRTSSSTLRILESWKERGESSGTHTPAEGSSASKEMSRALSPMVSRPSSPDPMRRDSPRSAAPSPDSRCLRDILVDNEDVSTSAHQMRSAIDWEAQRDDEITPSTPRIGTTPSNADETTYATVDGSPLVPSRHVTPTRPSSTLSNDVDHLLCASPPAALIPASPLASAPIASPSSAEAPTFKQPEDKVDEEADDQRFRKWIFPVPGFPSEETRPPFLRRHTMPHKGQNVEEQPSPTTDSGLSSRLEELRESLPSRRAKSVHRPAIPFGLQVHVENPNTASHQGSSTAEAAVASLTATLHEHILAMRMIQDQMQQRPPSPILDSSLTADSLRLLLLELEGSLLSALHERTHDDQITHSSGIEEILQLLRDQSNTLSSVYTSSALVPDLQGMLQGIETSQRTALDELLKAQKLANEKTISNRDQYSSQAAQMAEWLATLKEQHSTSADHLKQLLEAQPQVQELNGKLRDLEVNVSKAKADSESTRQKMDMDEKRHRVVESKLAAVKSKLEAAEERERVLQRDFEDALAGKLAAERVRDELAEALAERMDNERLQREELVRLAKELEDERAKPPPPPLADPHADKLEAIRAASETLRTDLVAQVQALSVGMQGQSELSKSQNEQLAAENEALRQQLAALREERDLDRTEKEASDKALRDQVAAANLEMANLRAQLNQERTAHTAAKDAAAKAEEASKILSEQLVESRMVARDRLATCRMNEALAQETHYWRHFALSYDRKEYRAFMAKNPTLLKKEKSLDVSPEIRTPADSRLLGTEQVTPTKFSMASIPETPSLVSSATSSPEL